jgi:predicted ATP-grasp superfamily ATP-dependent carboligase
MGWVAACVLVGMLLPLLGMVYLDVLQMKQEAKQQIEKMEKVRKEVEKEKRDDPNSRIPPR